MTKARNIRRYHVPVGVVGGERVRYVVDATSAWAARREAEACARIAGMANPVAYDARSKGVIARAHVEANWARVAWGRA